MLTDTLDLTQSKLLQHAYSQYLALLIDVSDIETLQSIWMAGVDLDHTETWDFQYFNGTDHFRVEVTDGTHPPIAFTVLLHVQDSDDDPLAVSQSVSVNEDDFVSITLEGSDPDNEPMTFAISSEVSHGLLLGF